MLFLNIVFMVLCCLIVFMLGASLGSFFNVILCRLPKHEGFVKTRSHCPECNTELKWLDLFPVFSMIILKGRCRYCKTPIKAQYLIMEILCGSANLWAFLALGFDYKTLIAFILFPVLAALSVEDINKTEIPYWCTGIIAVLGIIATILSAINPNGSFWHEHLIGMIVISVPFAVFCYLGAMGGGDVQLTAAAGLLLGWGVVPAMLIAIVSGAVFGVFIKLTRKRAVISFGPFISIGIAVGYLYGYQIIRWYAEMLR